MLRWPCGAGLCTSWRARGHISGLSFSCAAIHNFLRFVAGWDTNSDIVPPPDWSPPPSSTDVTGDDDNARAGGRCSSQPIGCNLGGNAGPCRYKNPTGGTWLFDLDADPSETCDLSAAEPAVLAEAEARLDRYRATEVPVRYPDGDSRLDGSRCAPKLDYVFAIDEADAEGCHG